MSGTDTAAAYSRRDRRADQRRGRLDGRTRVPSYTRLAALVDERKTFTTAYVEELWKLGLDHIQAEYVDYERRATAKRQRLAGLRERLVAAEADAERGAAAVRDAEAELTPAELLPRNPQEFGRHPEVLRSRRVAMRERRIQVARDRQARRFQAIDDVRRQVAETCQDLDQEFATAQARARRVGEHFRARVATYWGAVAATHSEGRQLALLLPHERYLLPAWLSATSRCGDQAPPTGDQAAGETAGTE